MNPNGTKANTAPSRNKRRLTTKELAFTASVSLVMTMIVVLITTLRRGDFAPKTFFYDWMTGWLISFPALLATTFIVNLIFKRFWKE